MTFADRQKAKRLRRRQEFLSTPSEEAIPFGFNTTEFEVQAFLYWKLKEIGYLVRGEVRSKCLTCRFDLVVYQSDGNEVRPIRIIEVKKSAAAGSTRKARRAAARKRIEQIDRYAVYGVPVDLVCSLREAKAYIEAVRKDPIT